MLHHPLFVVVDFYNIYQKFRYKYMCVFVYIVRMYNNAWKINSCAIGVLVQWFDYNTCLNQCWFLIDNRWIYFHPYIWYSTLLLKWYDLLCYGKAYEWFGREKNPSCASKHCRRWKVSHITLASSFSLYVSSLLKRKSSSN